MTKWIKDEVLWRVAVTWLNVLYVTGDTWMRGRWRCRLNTVEMSTSGVWRRWIQATVCLYIYTHLHTLCTFVIKGGSWLGRFLDVWITPGWQTSPNKVVPLSVWTVTRLDVLISSTFRTSGLGIPCFFLRLPVGLPTSLPTFFYFFIYLFSNLLWLHGVTSVGSTCRV